ncbi:hypothetical protein U4T64_15245, partial [Escherichia coli]|nr:hypothetical protein [Escherichia coli]
MKVRDLKALLETMPGEADVVWQNDDSTEDVIRCESGMYSIVDSVEKITSSHGKIMNIPVNKGFPEPSKGTPDPSRT